MIESEQFLRIAKIIGAHGLKGRLRLLMITDISERFSQGSQLFLKIDQEYKPFICTEFIGKGINSSIIKLENIDDRNAALVLKGYEIFITKSEAEKTRQYLDEDTFYYYDLIDCKVYLNNENFGVVSKILEGGETDILVIRNSEEKEYLIPFIDSMVDTKEIFNGRIDIYPIEGLFEEEFH